MDEQGMQDGGELTLAPTTIVARRRPKALWGVLAAVAVAAGALAVTSVGDDEVAPPLPIALGSTGERGAPEPLAADSALAWVTYVPGDDLPTLGGEAPAYRLSGDVDQAQVQALADALDLSGAVVHEGGSWTVVDAGGATLQVSEGAGASWWYSSVGRDLPVSAEDPGTVTSCVGTGSGGAPDCATETTLAPAPAQECPANADCVVDVMPPTVSCASVEAGDCPGPVPTPVADLPSEEAARSIALELLADAGLDTADAVVTVAGPYEAWYISVEPRLDGTPSGLLYSVSVGPQGAITYAGGYLSTPERLGDYPILDTPAAIARLNDQVASGGLSYGSVGVARDAVSSRDLGAPVTVCSTDPDAPTSCDEPVVSSPTTVPPCQVTADGSEICQGRTEPGVACPDVAPPTDQPLSNDQPIDCPTPGPLPAPEPLPGPTPEPVEIVLTGATATLVLVPASDGSTDAYLVPGYRFTGENDEQIDAPAVADEALAGPSTTVPPVTEPGVVEPPPVPDPGGTDGGGGSVDCEPLVEADGSGTTITVQPCVGADPTKPAPETTTTLVTEE